ncbi:hypothetical protein D9Q98_005067 [Chlorella vulgaris]|uniref:Erythromycin esterase n=1 Tax=Chlorella vulgaris TaxID=3077 RepID=A0A9D4TNL5_CHLVU|nr:hypothetical protein D9Q98_005067 [Chlorella vulgaris]
MLRCAVRQERVELPDDVVRSPAALCTAAHVVQYLSQVDPEAASRVKARYKCFDRYGADTMAYAYAVGMAGAPSCANAALATLKDIGRKVNAYSAKLDGEKGEELAFAAHCNAAVVKGAEAYYANMFFGEELTWNLRDHHFLDTVKSLRSHLTRRVPGPKLILWAHNSHLGDASATDMGQRRGEINIGQLMRQEFGAKAVFNIGFTTHTGTVSAADDWDTPVQLKAVRKSMPGSYEHLFHRHAAGMRAACLPASGDALLQSTAGALAGMPEFVLDLRGGSPDLRAALEGPLLERAIGVIYRPVTERQSHYFSASLSRQFDAVVHLDTTSALHPLEKTGAWERDWRAREDAPETYPFAV